MVQIKFLHNYPKLWNQNRAILLKASIINSYEMDSDLIEYDTKNERGEYYKLPVGNLIHLTFLGNKMIPFCTIRRHTPQKFSYYKNVEGEEFLIVLTSTRDSSSPNYNSRKTQSFECPNCRAMEKSMEIKNQAIKNAMKED